MRGFRAIYLGLFFNCMIMATVNLAACKIAGDPVRPADAGRRCSFVGVLNVVVRGALRALGRARHRHDPVLHQDDGGDRRGVLRAAGAAGRRPARAGRRSCRRCAGPAASNYLEHAARLHQQLGPGRRGLHHADRRAVVGGLVSRAPSRAAAATSRSACSRRSRRRTRSARCSSSTSRTTCCGRGRGSSSALCSIIVYPELSDIQKAFPNLDPQLLGHDIAYPGDAEVPARRASSA